MENEIETLQKRVSRLEKKLEKYYSILLIENELDFILKGTYFLEEELAKVNLGQY